MNGRLKGSSIVRGSMAMAAASCALVKLSAM